MLGKEFKNYMSKKCMGDISSSTLVTTRGSKKFLKVTPFKGGWESNIKTIKNNSLFRPNVYFTLKKKEHAIYFVVVTNKY